MIPLRIAALLDPAVDVVGLAVLATAVAVGVAALYRWYAGDRAPLSAGLLAALAAVAGYLNVKTALGEAIAGETAVFAPEVAVFNLAALLAGVLVVPVGLRFGDRLAVNLVTAAGAREVDAAVSPLVRVVGRAIAVTLPEKIEDIEGYDPVDDATRETLAGRTFTFPKGLTVAEVHDRLVARLRAEYEVGHVDIDLTEDGSVEYLAVGERVAGLGPTLPPGTAAVAVTADPANTASAGDVVQLWRGDPPERVTTAEIRAVAGDTVTLAVDAHEARGVAGGNVRLVTLPAEPRPGQAFVGVLRAADETTGAVRVAADSPLAGTTVGALDAAVVALRPAGSRVEAIPADDRAIAGGDTLYVVASPETIRRLEARAGGAGA